MSIQAKNFDNGTRNTDQYVHDNPWKAIAYGAAIGAAFALLATAITRRD